LNLYSKKQWWKIVLFVLAILIAGGFLWYNNVLVDNWRKEERKKLEQWSQAIKKKADLVNLIDQSFEKQREEERRFAVLLAKAHESIANDGDAGLSLEIIRKNKSIPVIITNESNEVLPLISNVELFDNAIKAVKKLDPGKQNYHYKNEAFKLVKDTLAKTIVEWKKKHPPIEIIYFQTSGYNIYYNDSKVFVELQNQRDSLIASFKKDIEKAILVPVIYCDSSHQEVFASSFSDLKISSSEFVKRKVAEMAAKNKRIHIDLGGGEQGYIYYEDSVMLKQLRFYPYIQFAIVGAFLIIAYLIFSTFRKAEQNQVWVGMAKETAHQLGTPLSSLLAWMQLLKDRVDDQKLVEEMSKDIQRLEIITDRFSKIGSKAAFKKENTVEVIQNAVDYLAPRVSKKVIIDVSPKAKLIESSINVPLFEWVIENLTKNAVDAMEGKGQLTFNVSSEGKKTIIDIIDTGKGIAANKFKTIFEPGFTTKKRGWGLGLSLVKRIIENYHKGKIFVRQSEIGKGTTFRIVLKK